MNLFFQKKYFASFNGLSFWFMLGLMVYLLLYHTVGYFGHYGYDDMRYAALAKQMVDGTFDLNNGDHFSYRWALLVPTAISYKLFGVSDLSSAIPGWLCTFATLFLVWYVSQFAATWSGRVGEKVDKKMLTLLSLTAMVLYLLSYGTLFYADKIMSDIYVAFAAFGAVVVLFHQKYITPSINPICHALGFTFLLFLGLLGKETIVFFIPVCCSDC